ncbi:MULTISPECIES: hypothetical protein [Mesorhizobium]|uniref:hypothetical protein n=1 Tax=Mesorhizobium TaxID=68287 RepID=UPI001FE06100|nr:MULTISPECIES: hypothetical protein [Mesorhizobium]
MLTKSLGQTASPATTGNIGPFTRILDACADNASVEQIADLILAIDPILEPVRARKVVRSHIDRANWMVTSGSKHLFGG